MQPIPIETRTNYGTPTLNLLIEFLSYEDDKVSIVSKSIRKEALWVLANIIGGGNYHCKILVDYVGCHPA